MRIDFTKMHGLGNDFVLLDHLDSLAPVTPEMVAFLADRRLGVGCDQVVRLLPAPPHALAQVEMQIYNADGSQAEMCGNAARCVALYLRTRRNLPHGELDLLTLAGVIRLSFTATGQVAVDMGTPHLLSQGELRLEDLLPREALAPFDPQGAISDISMGNPHCVIVQPTVQGLDIERLGSLIEHHHRYPQRTNVEFIQILDQDHLRMRVWERGCGITPACGTGACAAAVAAMNAGLTHRRVVVHLDGGDLEIVWREDNNHVIMTGSATEVFQGSLTYRPDGA